MTFGTSPYGTSSYGGGTVLSVLSCRATSTHTVLVELAAPPLAESAIGDGDALNPASWFVRLADLSFTFTVMAVRKVSLTEFELRTLEPLRNWLTVHEAGAPLLMRMSGGLRITAPRSATFRGVVVEGDRAVNPLHRYDFANNPTGGSTVGGTLKVNSGGTYARDSGTSLVRKMVIRRILTMPGSFFSIPPEDFGADLRIGGLFNPSSLPQLKASLERELLKEPDTTEATVSLVYQQGVITITARVKSVLGVQVPVTVEARA